MTTTNPAGRTINVALPGRAWNAALESAWPDENPRGGAALRAGTPRKVGAGGRQWFVRIDEGDARDLAFHLESIADVWECMTREERGSDDPRTIRRAVARIHAALEEGA